MGDTRGGGHMPEVPVVDRQPSLDNIRVNSPDLQSRKSRSAARAPAYPALQLALDEAGSRKTGSNRGVGQGERGRCLLQDDP